MTCKEFRKAHGYTLVDVSIATGFSFSTISKWENGVDDMQPAFVSRMKRVYGVDIELQTKNKITKKEHNKIVEAKNIEIAKLKEEKAELERVILKLAKKIDKIKIIAGR